MTDLLTVNVRIPAPPDAVRAALTDPAAMRMWLAEKAEADLPNRYAFWGRFTPEGDAPHQRPLYADERTLRFGWLLDGEDTTVEISLEPDGDRATTVTLTQTHFSYDLVFSGTSIRGVLETFWALALANLADHLAGRELTPVVDFTSTEMRATALVDATPEEVYEALVDSGKVSQWFGYPIEVDLESGELRMGGQTTAKIIDITPGRSMSTDWGPAGVHTWELEESGGKTRLTFVQSGFDTGNPPYAAWGGLLSGLASLRRFLELEDWNIYLTDEQPA
jgi:uncharacterized protein YndB with AHSA1/START domain